MATYPTVFQGNAFQDDLTNDWPPPDPSIIQSQEAFGTITVKGGQFTRPVSAIAQIASAETFGLPRVIGGVRAVTGVGAMSSQTAFGTIRFIKIDPTSTSNILESILGSIVLLHASLFTDAPFVRTSVSDGPFVSVSAGNSRFVAASVSDSPLVTVRDSHRQEH